ncbi:MAG: hypothetical protein IH599_00040 [Bacteroidales bacterium]|nr:hypothetical protein [Bacteroidales bacterium]
MQESREDRLRLVHIQKLPDWERTKAIYFDAALAEIIHRVGNDPDTPETTMQDALHAFDYHTRLFDYWIQSAGDVSALRAEVLTIRARLRELEQENQKLKESIC